MNIKIITISSLLLCTAYAATTDQPAEVTPPDDVRPIAGADKLAAAIAAQYKDAEGKPTLVYSKLPEKEKKLLKELQHDFHFDGFINDKGHEHEPTNPKSAAIKDYKFCGVIENEGTFPMIKALREKTAPSKAHFEQFNSIIEPKIDYVMEKLEQLPLGTPEKIKEALGGSIHVDLERFIKDQFEAFKAVLRLYEPKPKNFRGLRSMMEALHVVTRFESKAIAALDYLVENIKKANTANDMAWINYDKYGQKLMIEYGNVEKLSKDASEAEKNAVIAELNKAYKDYMKAMKVLAETSLISKALQTAKDKTSSAITLAWFLGVFVIVAMGMLVAKQIQLKKMKQEEEADSN